MISIFASVCFLSPLYVEKEKTGSPQRLPEKEKNGRRLPFFPRFTRFFKN